ncbi:MAG: YcxB family protein [Alphaproteobacteria bacterium]|nr:YcxB family protein [Alphaproteobacteria bacterium]
MSGEAITIEYQRTPDDMARFCAKSYFKRTGTAGRFKNSLFSNLRGMLAGICILFAVLLFVTMADGQSVPDVFMLTFAVFSTPFLWIFFGACLAVCVLPSLFKCESCVYRRCRKSFGAGENPDKPSVFYCQKTLTLSPDTITEESAYGRSDLFWTVVSSVEVLDGFFCLFIGGTDGGYIVPDRYFASAAEKQRVYEQCLTWHEVAQEKAA